MGNTVWFSYSELTAGRIVVDTLGSDFNTVLAIWEASAVPTVPPRLLACNDDDSFGNQTSALAVATNSQRKYLIQVGGAAASRGNLQLNVSRNGNPAALPPHPSNDNFADAYTFEALPGVGDVAAADVVDPRGATMEENEPDLCSGADPYNHLQLRFWSERSGPLGCDRFLESAGL